jgi:hypothetical protein
MDYTEIQALQNSADAARQAQLEELDARHSLAVATGVLLGTLCGVVAGDVAIRSHVEGIVGIRRDQLEPLANSLGFSLQPSPTYVGQFIIVPLE